MLEIAQKATKLRQRFRTSNPFTVCEGLGINVRLADLGGLKGFYKYYMKNRFIVINSNICEKLQKMVCAHELGHDILHRDIAKQINFWETTLWDMSGKVELEANIFASELLIDDEDILNIADDCLSVEKLASLLGVDENIVKLKVCIMKEKGYNVNADFSTKINFLQ